MDLENWLVPFAVLLREKPLMLLDPQNHDKHLHLETWIDDSFQLNLLGLRKLSGDSYFRMFDDS